MGNPGLPSTVPGEATIVKSEQSLGKRSKSTGSKRPTAHSAKPVETKIEPAIATLAHLQTVLEDYLEPKDINKVKDAYRFADQAHLGQFRSSGSPYITHPISVGSLT
jgi:hypothetical protein